MSSWLTANLGTILVSLALLGIVVWITASMLREKKRGGSSCGCSGNCASCGCCSHKLPQQKEKS